MKFTCANCPHLIRTDLISSWLIGCNKTDTVVPHSNDGKNITFGRIPLSCPLPDSEVEKREKPQPKKKWETITLEKMLEVIPENTRKY